MHFHVPFYATFHVPFLTMPPDCFIIIVTPVSSGSAAMRLSSRGDCCMTEFRISLECKFILNKPHTS